MDFFSGSRVFAVLAASIGITASAQVPAGSRYEALLRKAFDGDPGAISSQCAATPIRPTLDFSLRFQAGFTMDVPLSPSGDARRHGVVLLRVTPERGSPAYTMSRIALPDTAATKQYVRVQGGFVVGEGKYNVAMIFVNGQRQVCRSQWQIDAAAPQTASLPVKPLPLGKLTILMRVAPPSPNLAKLPERDERQLLQTLLGLLSHVNAQTVSVVVFNLEQQKVLFRKDEFAPADFNDVTSIVHQAQFGLVDYSALRNPKGAANLLTELTEEQRDQLHASDALVFLGSHAQVRGSISARIAKKLQNGPRIFYLECDTPVSLSSAARDSGLGITAESPTVPATNSKDSDTDIDDSFSTPDQDDIIQPVSADDLFPPIQTDIVAQLVRRLKGEVIPIRKPSDCVRAIRLIAPHGPPT